MCKLLIKSWVLLLSLSFAAASLAMQGQAPEQRKERVGHELDPEDAQEFLLQFEQIHSWRPSNILGSDFFPALQCAVTYFDDQLGKGSHGLVNLGYMHREDLALGTLCAYKQISHLDEFNYHSLFNHPNISQCFVLGDESKLIMEFVATNLFNYITSQQISYEEQINLALQIARGLKEIHSKGIVHQDLNSSNILFDPQTHTLKISDFGSAQAVGEINMKDVTPSVASPIQNVQMIVAKNKQWITSYTHDIWSLGVLYYFINTKLMPKFSVVNVFRDSIVSYHNDLRNFHENYMPEHGLGKIIKDIFDSTSTITLDEIIKRLEEEELYPSFFEEHFANVAPAHAASEEFVSKRYYFGSAGLCPRCEGSARSYYHDQICQKCHQESEKEAKQDQASKRDDMTERSQTPRAKL